MSFPAPDQVEGDVKDTVYQIAGTAFFIRMGFPIKLGMTLRTRYHSIFRLAGRNDEMKDACFSVIFALNQVENDIMDKFLV